MKYRTSFNEMLAKLGKHDMVWVHRRNTVLAVSCEIREGCMQKAASEGLPGAGKPEEIFQMMECRSSDNLVLFQSLEV